MHTNLPPGVPRCHHIKVNGTRCDSSALKGKAYCYFHFRARVGSPLPPNCLAEAQEPPADSSNLPADRCPLATAPAKRPPRRARTAPLATDHRPLTTARPAALSLMFQREVRRHLDRLNFPVSPDSAPET